MFSVTACPTKLVNTTIIKTPPKVSRSFGGGARFVRRAEPEIPTNPIFSEDFQAALKEALSTEGIESLTGRPEDQIEPPPVMGAAEEVLLTAVAVCKQNLKRLVAIENEIDACLEKERAQLNRLQFALKKAVDDHAYAKTMEKRVADLKEK
eukprot:TRINITY_DN15982_c0_g4_i1.p2 TRINITY_DN15982_c0_g4~~TRINITY_DN15982_c0_g4_i1.p2  ORF type:complete len:151 (-),score=43.10 TRINITY_DN15982_c0_g4_i1:191-643(-)